MLEDIKNRYYQGWGNHLDAIQDLRAKLDFLPDKETSYVSQMGKTPLSLKSYKYLGENTTVSLPRIAVKPGKDSMETYLSELDYVKNNPNKQTKVLVRHHTHPTHIDDKDYTDIRKPPSPQDMVNAASVYTVPQNRNLRYNKNSIYTKEGGRSVKYTYDIPEDVKQKIINGDQGDILRYAAKEHLSNIPMSYKSMAGAKINSLRGKGDYQNLANTYYADEIMNRYKRMGYPVTRQEL